MSEPTDFERVVASIKKVPEKRLLIIELANSAPRKGGQLDYDKLSNIQPEVNAAIAEAKMYGAHTIQAVEVLVRLMAKGD